MQLVTSPEHAFYEAMKGVATRMGMPKETLRALRFYAERHPAGFDLASLRWALGKIGVRSAICRIDRVKELPASLPCIVECKDENGVFLFEVETVEEDLVSLFYGNKRNGNVYSAPLDKFEEKYTGIALVVDGEAKASVDPQEQLWKGHCLQWRFQVLLLMTALAVLGAMMALTYETYSSIPRLMLQVWSTVGLLFSALLLRRYWGTEDWLASRLCSFGTHGLSCTTRQTIRLPWGIDLPDVAIAFFVFVFVLASMPVMPILLCIVSLAGVLFVPFSLHEQHTRRSWCVLCLAVDFTLCILGILGLLAVKGSSMQGNALDSFLLTLAAAGGGTIVSYGSRQLTAFRSLYAQEKRLFAQAKYRTLKVHATTVFTPIEMPLKDQAIHDGYEESAKVHVIFVLNQTCNACRQHARYFGHTFARKYETSLSIVVMSKEKSERGRRETETFLRSCAEMGLLAALRGEGAIRNKPIGNSNAAHQLQHHRAWCDANGIRTTPTLCINGRRLPPVFSAEDIDYLCV